MTNASLKEHLVTFRLDVQSWHTLETVVHGCVCLWWHTIHSQACERSWHVTYSERQSTITSLPFQSWALKANLFTFWLGDIIVKFIEIENLPGCCLDYIRTAAKTLTL